MSLLQAVYNFFSESSKRHEKFLFFQQFSKDFERVVELQNLSKTRWYCRIAAIKALCKSFKPIIATLVYISTSSDFLAADRVTAKGLKDALLEDKFIFNLVMFDEVLSTISLASQYLQQKDLVYTNAFEIIKSTILNLKQMRTEKELKICLKQPKILRKVLQQTKKI